jgi:hypothetical protein
MRQGAILIASAILLSVTRANAQDTAKTHPVRILEVRDAESKELVVGADVTDILTNHTMRTSEDGAIGLFVPQFVREDGAVLRITKLGYRSTGPLIVNPIGDTTIVVLMTRQVAELPTVATTAAYNLNTDPGERSGIAARCAYKTDFCVGTKELMTSPTKSTSEFLKSAPGVIVKCSQGNADFDTESLGSIMLGPRGRAKVDGSNAHTTCNATMAPLSLPPKRCVPTFFVNGQIQMHAGTTVSILDQVDAAYPNQDLFTIEVFDSFHPRPLKFTGDPLCGAIVIWTKQRVE